MEKIFKHVVIFIAGEAKDGKKGWKGNAQKQTHLTEHVALCNTGSPSVETADDTV